MEYRTSSFDCNNLKVFIKYLLTIEMIITIIIKVFKIAFNEGE